MGSVATPDTQSYLDFESHVSAIRSDTGITVASLLRHHHPDHTVVEVDTQTVDLFNFARLGHATCILDDSDPRATHRLVHYTQPQFRHSRSKNDGKVEEKILWGRWKYTWENQDFLIYQAHITNLIGRPEKHDFLLTPTSPSPSAAQKLLLVAGHLTTQLFKETYIFDQGRWSKSKDLYNNIQKSNWADVILPPSLKTSLITDVQSFFDSQDLYSTYSVPWKRGIIFHGSPGNGKTVSLTAIMAALGSRTDPIPSLYVKTLENCNGPAFAIRSIFEKARITAPCLLIFEDLDSMITDKTRSYFLNEVDGLESNNGILMIGSTNHIETLDPALRDRPSRFDRKYHFELPGLEQREAYARYWHGKVAANSRATSGGEVFPDEACELIARFTPGFSFAYLKELFIGSLLSFARASTGETKAPESSSQDQATGAQDDGEIGAPESSSQNHATNTQISVQTSIPTSVQSFVQTSVQTNEETLPEDPLLHRQQALAAVEIPAQLQSNQFLRILRAQVAGLIKEMDNTASMKLKVTEKIEKKEGK